MTIRTTIILLAVPLFVLLAAVNGALLNFQEEAEITQALHEQAEAAAVTSAAFIARMENPHATLAAPRRAAALAAAARELPGVDALYLVSEGSPPRALFPPSRGWVPGAYRRPDRVEVRPVSGAVGDRHVVALGPAAPGSYVVARIDAEPLMHKIAGLRRFELFIVLAAGLIATALGWLIARRITDELGVSAAAIAAIGAGRQSEPGKAPTIREAGDLADAVRLMKSSNDAAARRDELVLASNDRVRTVGSAFSAWRGAQFAPLDRSLATRRVALRQFGDAPLGCFFALCEDGDQAAIVVGRCHASAPADALASGLAARRFLEANMFAIPPEECLALARAAYAIAELRSVVWRAGESLKAADRLVALTDDESARGAAAHAARNPDAAPDRLLDSLAVLIAPDGVFAALAAD